MPLLKMDAIGADPALHGSTAPLRPALQAALTGSGPIILMVHGYKFSPGHRVACPHRHILSLEPRRDCRKAASWPAALGLGGEGGATGIAFGWHARGTIWQAHRSAADAGEALAKLIQLLRQIAPHRPVHAIAHSLGARVVLCALPRLEVGALRRIILLAGAEYASRVRAALHSPAGRSTELFNMASHENHLFDRTLEKLIAAPAPEDRPLGLTALDLPNALTVQIGNATTLEALTKLGFAIAPPKGQICHWSTYLRGGVFSFYRALLLEEERFPQARLRCALPDLEQANPPFTLPALSFNLPTLPSWRTAR